MKQRKHSYRIVEELPANALSVAQYAANIKDCTTPYIYELWRNNKADFEIVVFKDFNFIIPLTNN